MKVLCIKSANWVNTQTNKPSENPPVIGHTYTVIANLDEHYILKELRFDSNGKQLAWEASCFEIIDGTNNGRPVEVNHKPSSIVPNCPPVIVGIPGT